MAGKTWGWILGLIGFVLKPLLKAMTPDLEQEWEKMLISFYHKALKTDNPIDDLLMRFVLEIFDIPKPD